MFICSGSSRGIELRRVKYEGTNLTVSDPIQLIPDCRCFAFSPKQNFVAFYTRSGLQTAELSDKVVHICAFNPEAGTITEIQTLDVPNIVRVKFSPNGTFFALILRKNSVTDSGKIPLVQIYRTGGPMVRAFNYPSDKRLELFWSEDERIFASSFSDGVKFYEIGADGTEREIIYELPNLLACAFSCSRNVVRFASVNGTEPKRMKIFEFPKTDKPIVDQPVMVGEEFTIQISPSGFSAIAIGNRNSDETYFGESHAYYLNTQGQKSGSLKLKKPGPVHCFEYSFAGDKFVSIAGHVPPAVALHFEKIGTAFEFGEMSVNSVRWSPTANLVAIGGFGSFTGDIKVIDTQKRTIISHGEAPCTSEWSWSPCGRLILTSVNYPKMQVSNEIRVHNHMCQKIHGIKMTELTQCEWVGTPNPQPLPKIVAVTASPPAPAAYVPPHLRGKAGPVGGKTPANPPGFGK